MCKLLAGKRGWSVRTAAGGTTMAPWETRCEKGRVEFRDATFNLNLSGPGKEIAITVQIVHI